MLAPQSRLRKARDIARVYKKGAYGGAGGVLSAKAAPSGRAVTRLVVVVPKKVSKRAVVRNHIRRRLLGQLQQRWATVPSGYDIVISVHSDVESLPGDALWRHLSQALERATGRSH